MQLIHIKCNNVSNVIYEYLLSRGIQLIQRGEPSTLSLSLISVLHPMHLSFLTANIIIPPALAEGVGLQTVRV